jgi:hypothetical protein
MKVLYVFSLGLFMLAIQSVPCGAPLYYSQIGTSEVNYATAYNNGYKVAVALYPENTYYATYNYNESTCYFAYSFDEGQTWTANYFLATTFGNAQFPSIDVYDSLPYIVTQGDSGGQNEIFLKCPLDSNIPQRVSNTIGNSALPAIVIDDSFNCHIVWQENTPENCEVYYCCAHYPDSVIGTANLSKNGAEDLHPSISIFNGDEVHVVWLRYDSYSYSPYSIVHRYFNAGVWSDEDTLVQSTHIPHHHPSLDFSHGEDEISAVWEDSSSGNLDIFFYQGNLIGWPTIGQSRYPALSTIGSVWSYAYWEDNSDGYNDIYAYLYYFLQGGTSYKFRDIYGSESMRHPNTNYCFVIWTQGNVAPYKVMFAYEGYPIGVEGALKRRSSHRLHVFPNPFRYTTHVELAGTYARQKIRLEIFDISGRLVKSSLLGVSALHLGKDFSPGIYFLKVAGSKPVKLVKLE